MHVRLGSNQRKVLSALEAASKPICDDCLAEVTDVISRQVVNVACCRLKIRGLLKRAQSTCPYCKGNKLLNWLDRGAGPSQSAPSATQPRQSERRQPAPASPRPMSAAPPLSPPDGPSVRRWHAVDRVVGLVSCVKTKLNHPARAAELYTSPYFKKSKEWITGVSDEWYILSAKYGLLHPTDHVEPYDLTLNSLGAVARREWAQQVLRQMRQRGLVRPDTGFIWAAGRRYNENLVSLLVDQNHHDPMAGLAFGPRLQWLTEQADQRRQIVGTARYADVVRLYSVLQLVRDKLGGLRRLVDCDGRMDWPERGIYFFFDGGERRSTGVGWRVVRVGTHAVSQGSRTTLWQRLSQHRGRADGSGGNHRGSIFRLHVGECLLRSRQSPVDVADTWGQGFNVSQDIRQHEQPLEERVSQSIGEMGFLWLPILDAPTRNSLRSTIERNTIGLLSNSGAAWPIDPPSDHWLGHHSTRSQIRASGLWNVNYVSHGYDPSFLQTLEDLIDRF